MLLLKDYIVSRKYFVILFLAITGALHAQSNSIANEVEDTTLEELIIQIEKIDSKWTKIFKKPKIADWSNSMYNYPIHQGSQVVTKYIPNKDIRFNGVSFILLTAENTTAIKKALRPIIYQISPSSDTISLVYDNFIQVRDMKSGVSLFKKKGSEVTFEFNYVVEINKDEPVYIGFEFLNTDESEVLHDAIISGPLREKQKPILETKIVKGKSHNGKYFLYKDEVEFMNGLYFELKVVK